jgi:hypothetical protein
VTVSLAGFRDRVTLRESVAGEIGAIDVTPEPVAVRRRDGSVTVFWDLGESPQEATLEYTADVGETAVEEDLITFEGFVEDGTGRFPVGGDETASVVEDVFQRVVERGSVSDADVEVAVERDGVTAAEVDRLRRAWLGDQ